MGLIQAAHFTAYRSKFSTISQKALYLAEKLTGHYRDWFSSHSILSPGILQNYNLFISSFLSFSREDKELSTPSASQFAGLTQELLPLSKYNQKFCSLQSRLQVSDAKACSFYKIGLKKFLQLSGTKDTFPQKHILLPSYPLQPGCLYQTRYLFVQPLHLVPSQRLEEAFASLLRKSSEKGTITSAPTVDKRTIFYQPALSLSTSTITLLSLSDTSKSPTVLVTIHGPLGKIKVLSLLNTGANANFIEEKLANLIGLTAFKSLDVKVGNSTLTDATPISNLSPLT
ncbi:hypothetical protein DSO57_1035844 [Entomophthora muscae]|uniref:Uncharacterized protein n=1 Tax=Entomophthora muscae TaxID=34485 RepID=A0ACC2U9U3_9FUNG|nr:hypothetical protein DSO57_1035844 [Entomophthora muscae]